MTQGKLYQLKYVSLFGWTQNIVFIISYFFQEVETLNLEETWCYDSKGNRTIPTAEEQAAEISQRLAEFPHLVEGNKSHTFSPL